MNIRKTFFQFFAVPVLVGFSASAFCDVAELQHNWAVALYEAPKEDRESTLENLAESARALAAENPADTSVLIWEGIILSTLAGEKGGLGALSLCKEARAALEKSISIDPSAMQGSALGTLGSLYYQVPGWPIGFGDHKKARDYLQRALELNPDGIDSNYFMADFLHEEDEDAEALRYLDKAAHAPARPGRELADAGRRKEIEALRKEIGTP